MARSTSNPNREIPEGMKAFEVIRSTVRDSVGQFCVPGDQAILTRKIAQAYLDANLIRVPLPDFGDGTGEEKAELDESDKQLHEAGHAEPAANGRAEARKQEIKSARDEASRIIAEAEAEAEQVRKRAATSSNGPAGNSTTGSEQSPTGGQASDADGADKKERSKATSNSGGSLPKRRSRASSQS